MKITAIEIENVRGFQQLPKLDFSQKINILIGPNNAGKSTILNAIFLLQRQTLNRTDITIGQEKGRIQLFYDGAHKHIANNHSFKIVFDLMNDTGRFNNGLSFSRITEREPDNLIYPYLSKRKVGHYNDTIDEASANSVLGNFMNLYSKIDRLITPQFQPGNSQYVEACKGILGFEVSTLAKGNGKQAVYFVHNSEHIPLTAMGEGVANIVGLITDLCIAENRIFLIEEPENDIHPKALKALLKLIIEKSTTNQFFISTHSNIVMKYLGGEDSKIFNITNDIRDKDRKNLFISEIKEISEDPEERRQVLEDLGYDFFDFDLWKGWLFLEESSAEIIIRDYLIDWFVKPLKNKIRTFSAGGSGNILPKFEDFDKLFVFLHLEPAYKNQVWVIIDAGKAESAIITKMKERYVKSGWNESNFSQLTKHDFEEYYPKVFQARVKAVLQIQDVQKKRTEKRNLLKAVKDWIQKDETKAKELFKESAKEVIDYLKRISSEMR